jgi:hypothetical protein
MVPRSFAPKVLITRRTYVHALKMSNGCQPEHFPRPSGMGMEVVVNE